MTMEHTNIMGLKINFMEFGPEPAAKESSEEAPEQGENEDNVFL